MNFYNLERIGLERTARFHREAAVGAIARASGTPLLAVTTARALRRLAERIDRSQPQVGSPHGEVAQPTLKLALHGA